MKQDTKVLLGLTRDELWALPGLVLMAIAFFFSDVPIVGMAVLCSVFFFSIYFVRTLPKYFRPSSLSRFMRLVGLAGNLLVLLFLVAFAAGMFSLALQEKSAFDYVHEKMESAMHKPPADDDAFERVDR